MDELGPISLNSKIISKPIVDMLLSHMCLFLSVSGIVIGPDRLNLSPLQMSRPGRAGGCVVSLTLTRDMVDVVIIRHGESSLYKPIL